MIYRQHEFVLYDFRFYGHCSGELDLANQLFLSHFALPLFL